MSVIRKQSDFMRFELEIAMKQKAANNLSDEGANGDSSLECENVSSRLLRMKLDARMLQGQVHTQL